VTPEQPARLSAAQRLLALPHQRREALNALLQRGQGARLPLRPRHLTREIQLSYGQQRLWFLHQSDPASPAYNIPAVVPLPGTLDAGVVRRALAEILRRHSVLRTVFRTTQDGPVQDILPVDGPDLRVVTVHGASDEERRQRLASLAADETKRPFDLASGPVLRSVLFRLADTDADAVLLMTMPHIVSDGWSLGILFHELRILVEAFARGAPSPLGELPVQYADFAMWQRETMSDAVLASQVAYWRKQLAGASDLQMPLDRPRPAAPTYRGAQVSILVSAAIREKLQQVNRSEDVTMHMTLLAVCQALLHRYSGQDDIVIGSPIAGRGSPETERLVGFFVNTLVIRTDLGGTPSFRECLRRVRRVTLEAFENPDVPFERLVSALHARRDLSRNPIFQITFQLFTGAQSARDTGEPIRGTIEIDKGTAVFDLAFNLWETARGIEGRIEYSTDLFDRDTIERMAGHFVTLADGAASNPDGGIDDIRLLTKAEHDRILFGWNATSRPRAEDRPVHEMVEAHAAGTPGQVAIRASGVQVTFDALNRRANRIAHTLLAMGIGAEAPVGVCLPRSPDQLASQLGAMKAGGAYLPIDPGWPAERIRSMLEDAGAAIVIAPEGLVAAVALRTTKLLSLDSSLSEHEHDPRMPVALDQLAYIIYTSGSTGRPKGVAVEHRALRNLVDWHVATYRLTPEDRTTQIASLSFDAAVWEVWPALSAGASVSLPDEQIRTSAELLLSWLASEGATITFLPTPLAEAALSRQMPASLRLRDLLTGGDRLRRRPAADMPFRVTNHYGPTENTVVATAGLVEPGDSPVLPGIGRPIANNQVYVLDGGGQPVPVGVAGELFIGGASLARGYHRRPELTAQCFVPHPFSCDPSARLYRTGDQVRWRSDGTIEFLGRTDRQIKIRGFRIEPGEVEAALLAEPDVREAAVVARPDARGELQLAAYVVPTDDTHAAVAWRERLGRRLPEYMLPAAFVVLDALPLTPHGKVDVAALPDPQRAPVLADIDESLGPTEEILAEVWRDVLRLDAVSPTADFFADYGGHSLLAVALVSRIRDALGVELQLRTVFEMPTIRGLATRLAAGPTLAARESPIPRRDDPHTARCSFAQQRLWFLDRLTPGKCFHNIPVAIRLETAIDPVLLQRSVDVMVERHEVLRTRLEAVDGVPVQRIAPALHVPVAVVDLRALPEKAREAEALRLASLEARTPFVLEGGVLFRVGLLRLAQHDSVLLATLHHIVCDGWSVEVFFREWVIVYEALASGEPLSLPPLTLQFADFADWQRSWLAGERLKEQLRYWATKLAGAPTLSLPADRPRPPLASYDGGRELMKVDAEVTSSLKALAGREGATLFMAVLAAFQTLLFRYSGQEDVVVGTVTAGRHHPGTEGVLGLFVNSLVLRTDLSGNPTFRELLTRAKEVALGAYEHSDLPFERLVEELQPERDLGRHPLVQVTLQLFSGSPEANAPASRQLDTDRGVATFDLALDMWEGDGGLKGRLEYSTDLFEARTVWQFLRHFERLLAEVARDPDQSIELVPILGPDELKQQLVDRNQTSREWPEAPSVVDLIERQAARTPDRDAVICGEHRLTYWALQQRVRRLARHLSAMDVAPGMVVALALERSVDWPASLLAVFACGAVALPVDPHWPVARLDEVLADAGASLALVQGASRPAVTSATLVDIDLLPAEDREVVPRVLGSHDVAYVLYTSGSTGRPKGVMVEHGSLANHARAVIERYGLAASDRVLQFAPLTFDVALEETIPTLVAGATIVMRPEPTVPACRELAADLTVQGVTVVNLPAAYWHQWADDLGAAPVPTSLRLIVVGSERVDEHRVAKWRRHTGACPRLINAYGATETTITALTYEVQDATWDATRRLPVGKPLANVKRYVLDRHHQPVPIGVTGDLYIGGAAVARGYIGFESAAFLSSLFDSGRLYRTGDRACELPGGDILYCGRSDGQLKVRGARVEVGEIVSALERHPGVSGATVVQEDDRLVAYVTGDQGVPEPALLSFLRARLPRYLVPEICAWVDTLPVDSHGKVDLRTLRMRLERRTVATHDAKPSTGLERLVAQIWEDALRVHHPGIDQNFFDIGGHSLLLLRVHSRLERELGREIAVVGLFQYPTIRSLARFLDGAGASCAPALATATERSVATETRFQDE
jgi:amino acid adenylation domain-containing protein